LKSNEEKSDDFQENHKMKEKNNEKNEKCSKIQILNFFFLFRKFNSMILFPI